MPLRFAPENSHAYKFPLTIGHLLSCAMQTAAAQQIVYRDRVRLTYSDLHERVGRLASALGTLGVTQGSVVAMIDWDSHRYLEAYFAIPMMGAVLQTVNMRLSPTQIGYTLRHGAAEYIICHRDFLPTLTELLPAVQTFKAVVVIDDFAELPLPAIAAGEYEQLLSDVSTEYQFEDFDENALATTFYTTGTTGDPKGVSFSHRQIVLLTLASLAPFGVTREAGFGVGDVYMPLTPMFHVHAWCLPYIATLLGVKQVYPGRYDPDLICQLRRDEGVTYSHCVPTVLRMILDAAAREHIDLSGWTITIGGSALTHSLWQEATDRGMYVYAGYGMSETGPTLTIARRSSASDFPATADGDMLTSAGMPIPLVSLRLVDDAMRDLPRDGQSRGELVARAPWLTLAYSGDPDASDALWRGGWLHTQDVATMDATGRVMICDRLKDVIKSGGEWISSLELENLIANIAGVAEVAVIGVPDARWGERPLVFIMPAGSPPSLDEVNQPISNEIAAGRLSRYARVDYLHVIEKLPRTSVGKIDKKQLRSIANTGLALAPSNEQRRHRAE